MVVAARGKAVMSPGPEPAQSGRRLLQLRWRHPEVEAVGGESHRRSTEGGVVGSRRRQCVDYELAQARQELAQLGGAMPRQRWRCARMAGIGWVVTEGRSQGRGKEPEGVGPA